MVMEELCQKVEVVRMVSNSDGSYVGLWRGCAEVNIWVCPQGGRSLEEILSSYDVVSGICIVVMS